MSTVGAWTTERGRHEVQGYLRRAAAGFLRHPANFSRQVLGVDLWSGQRKILRAMGEPHARVAVRGGHATSKSQSAAQLVLWGVACGFKVVTTASRFEQVRREIWSEVRGLIDGMEFLGTSGAALLGAEVRQTSIEISPRHFAVGWSTNEETRFQGLHGPRVLFIVDEAAGGSEGIYRAIAGSRAGGDVRELHLGNPSVPSGPFYEACRSREWTAIRLDAFDTPNLSHVRCEAAGVAGPGRDVELEEIEGEALDAVPRPYLAGPRWVREMLARYGPASNVWRWKVRGEFPQQDTDALILLEWIERAACREPGDLEAAPYAVGIDVAGPGEDEHVVAVTCGGHLEALYPWRGSEMGVERGRVREVLADRTVGILRRLGPRLRVVRVDEIGEGAHLVTILRRALPGVTVDGVNVAQSCRLEPDRQRYTNEKARLYWSLRERFREGTVSGIGDEVLSEQLSQVRYDEYGGRVRIESKDKMRLRGVSSPDRAEALMLALAPRSERDDDGVTFMTDEDYDGLVETAAGPRRIRGVTR